MIKVIAPKTITETLVQGMEIADRLTKVIIVGETVAGDPMSQVLIISGDTSLSDANFILDIVKQYVLTVPRDNADGGEGEGPPQVAWRQHR